MNRSRKIRGFLLIVVIVIQFIQPTKNISEGPDADDISNVYTIPSDVHETFKQKCYDCHSNNTRYPWYFHVQPIGWWLAAHIHDAKAELNFSEFKTYDSDETEHKFEDIMEMVEERAMPLKAYVLLHPHTEITEEDEQAIGAWINTLVAPEN